MSRRVIAMVAAATTVVVGGAMVATFELTGNPFEPDPVPVATLTPMPAAEPEAAPVVLPGAPGPRGESDADLAARMDEALSADSFGGRVGAVVADLATGAVVYESGGDVPMTPASTLKLVTGAAALDVLGTDHRFRTEVVVTADEGADRATITLVGGGDPVLVTERPRMHRSTPLAELADATAAALDDAGVVEVELAFDDSLFIGPAIDPDWRSTYVSGGVAAPVTALAVDGGRTTPGLATRAADPSQAAAEVFAAMLEDRGVAVAGEPSRTVAVDDAAPLAWVDSIPVADVVEYMIASSDNDIAEILARHVALGLGRDGSSDAASEATVDVLAGLGLDVTGLTVLDGSGLARGSAVPAALLVELMALSGDPAEPHLRPVLTGLPVAAFDGTLAARVDDAPGLVRAKTGTLTGVHTLAGVATALDGTTYLFAVMADDAADALGARAALDAVATALTR